ncbi:MAG: substrate-binding domain-containing protein, partial [Lacisediminihabitans sp.]
MKSISRPASTRRRRMGAIAVVATLGAVALMLSGCAGSGQKPASTTITLYNAQHEQTTTALVKAFTAKTGIIVKVDNDDEDVLTAKIEQEGTRSPADVIFTENSNWLQQLADRKLLA